MNAVDIKRLAHPSRQAYVWIIQGSQGGSCLEYKVNCRSQILALGHLVEFGRLSVFSWNVC